MRQNRLKYVLFLCTTRSRNYANIFASYARDKGWLSWKSCLEVFSPRDKWKQIANELSKIAGLSDDEKRTVRLLGAAMKRWKSGVEDDNPRKFKDVELEAL
jgi:hypothetical protein